MGDTKIDYDEKFGMNTFKREICNVMGEKFWDALTENLSLPDIEMECSCQCRNMFAFMRRFEAATGQEAVQKILYRVRHGLHPSQSAWAREEFLKIGDLDRFLEIHQKAELENFIRMNREGKGFYGQEITDEVLDFIRQNPAMLAPVRKGNKLICMAFPCNINEYIRAESSRRKRYHACHCPFAKESILADETVSPTLCYCSLGHVMNFSEAFLGRELEDKVVRSVLNGDLTCEYEATIPEDIMSKYLPLSESQMVIENYYRYYRIFALSGIVEFHEGPVDWIVPKTNEVGPSLAFHIRLSKSRWQGELDELMEGIRSKSVPARWLITPDADPNNIVEVLKGKGFKSLSEDAENPEPGMMLYKSDFSPYSHLEKSNILCKEIRTKEEFTAWVEVVNTALHGWEMIDAEYYSSWIEQDNIRLFLAEIDGVPVSTAATIQTGSTASLEFVSTLKEHRRQKAAITLCSRAIEALFDRGVETVTLSGSSEAVSLYERLGFHSCFNNMIMLYE